MYKLLCLLAGYIIVSSTILGYFVYESQQEQIGTLQTIDYKGNMINLDGSIPLNMFIDTSLSTNNILFTDINGIGEVLQINPSYSGIGRFDAIDSTIYIKGIQPTNNIYTVKYSIYNPNNADFSIISGMTDLNWFTGNKKIIITKFEDIGTNNARISLSFTDDTTLGYALTAPIYTNNNINSYWNNAEINIITSVFNTNDNTVSIYLNDNLIINNCPIQTNDSFVIFGGLRLEEAETIYIKNIETNVYLTDDNQNSDNLLVIIAQLLAWNVSEEYLPAIINIILVKLPLLFLSIGVALAIFGVS